MNQKIMIAMLPFFVAIIGMIVPLKKGSGGSGRRVSLGTIPSMLIASVVGIICYIFSNFHAIPAACMKVQTVLLKTIAENIFLLMSVSLLFVIVFIIKNSSVISALMKFAEKYINSPGKNIIGLIICSAILSMDDYLLATCSSMVFAPVGSKNGFSRAKTAYLVNLLAVSMCSLATWSTWSPVIRNSWTKMDEISDGFLYQLIPYNFVAWCAIFLVVLIGRDPKALNNSGCMTAISPGDHMKGSSHRTSYKELICFISVFAVLIGSLAGFTLLHVTNPLLLAAGCTALYTALSFVLCKIITKKALITAVQEAFVTSYGLVKLLLSIWLLGNITNELLSLQDEIRVWISGVSVNANQIPFYFFVLAACFSWMTASAFASFMFIPLAIEFTFLYANSPIQALSVAAVISGSLFACGSFGSDTMSLSAVGADCNLERLKHDQLPYSILLFVTGCFSYAVAGSLCSYGMAAVLGVLPASFIFMTISYYSLPWALNIYSQKLLSQVIQNISALMLLKGKPSFKHIEYERFYSLLIKLILKVMRYNLPPHRERYHLLLY